MLCGVARVDRSFFDYYIFFCKCNSSRYTHGDKNLHTLLVKYFNDLLDGQKSQRSIDKVTYFYVGDLFNREHRSRGTTIHFSVSFIHVHYPIRLVKTCTDLHRLVKTRTNSLRLAQIFQKSITVI